MIADRPVASRANRRLMIRLLVVTAAMFGFGYALVPLYDIVCNITGIGGRTGVIQGATATTDRPDSTEGGEGPVRRHHHSGLRWEFEAPKKPLEVHPGKIYEVDFTASNLSNRPVVGQAVPSVSPIAAAAHFNKIECFCFTPAAARAGGDPAPWGCASWWTRGSRVGSVP